MSEHGTSRRPSSFFRRKPPKSARDALQPVAAPQPPPLVGKRRRNGFVSFISGFLTIALIAAMAAGGIIWYVRSQTHSQGPLAESKVVVVRQGLWDMAEQLEREGVVQDRYMFMFHAVTTGHASDLKPGEYQFVKGASIASVVDLLASGKQILHSITFPEGLTSLQIVQRLRDNPLLRGDIRDIPQEGSLLPDTYKFARDTSRARIIQLAQQAQRRVVNEVWAKRVGDLPVKTIQEFVTLASIVEKETGKADERPRVAGVFINRLNRKMKLQSDPTIVYGLVQGKGTLGRPILRSEIESRTAYNTYVIEGLPPGPIANPGRAALEAVANPSRTRELFFVADGNGGHAFAETLDEHNRNVARWRAIERQRAGEGVKPVDKLQPPDEVKPGAPSPATPVRSGTPPRRRSQLGTPPVPATLAPADEPALAPANLSTVAAVPEPPLKPGARAARAIVEAIEGKKNDPLRNRTYDLNNPQTVPRLR